MNDRALSEYAKYEILSDSSSTAASSNNPEKYN